jgi:hypothetical protein
LALRLLGQSLYASTAVLTFGGGVGYIITTTGLFANTYMVSLPGVNTECNTTFEDPVDDIINGFREVALRMSVMEARENATAGFPVAQTVPYTSNSVRVQYAIDWRSVAAAVVVSLLGPAITLLLFWGWWELGRPFSLSPLELANAFHAGQAAELLSAGNGNAEAQTLVRVLRKGGGAAGQADPTVRYGVVSDVRRLGIGLADGNGVRRPQAGELL